MTANESSAVPSRTRRRFCIDVAAVSGLFMQTVLSHAQTLVADYPSRPVRWIVPTSPGGGTDATARAFALIASEAWKQPVVVDNRPGASGMIGLEALAAAAPDGYTLSFFSVSQFVDATLLKKFVFDARKDFTPISLLASAPLILVTNASTGITSLKQLVASAKSQPKALSYSSGGIGGITHLAMEIFLHKAAIDVLHVPYKGSGPAVVDLLGGQVQLSMATPAAVMQHFRSGKLRALALAAETRSPLAPEVPTFAEAGLPGISLSTWYGLFGPANMPADLVDKIARSVTGAARTTQVRDRMAADGIDPILGTPAEFARFVKAEREQWNAVARNITFQREK